MSIQNALMCRTCKNMLDKMSSCVVDLSVDNQASDEHVAVGRDIFFIHPNEGPTWTLIRATELSIRGARNDA